MSERDTVQEGGSKPRPSDRKHSHRSNGPHWHRPMQGRNNQAECEKADEVLGVDLLDILKKRLKKSSVKEKYARGFEPATTRSSDG